MLKRDLYYESIPSKSLRDDVRYLGNILGKVIKKQEAQMAEFGKIDKNNLHPSIICTDLNNNAFSNDKILNSLKDGKKLVFIRHAIAPGNCDPNNFEIDNCSTQRNLDKN